MNPYIQSRMFHKILNILTTRQNDIAKKNTYKLADI